MLKGIDVSNNNGSIDFDNVKNDGVSVVIIKATEGVDWKDPYLEEHYSRALNAGLHIGFYHFMSEKTNPSQQAVDFWNAISDKTFDVIPCLDIETNNQGRSSEEITDRCLEFVSKFKELSGMDVMIYTGGYFGRDNLDSRLKDICYGWIAHYGVDTPMETGFNVVGHQYTEYGKVDGVYSHCCDVNNFDEKILMNNKEEEKKVKNIVCVNNYVDRRAGEYLADFLQCPIIDNNLVKFDYSVVENVYCVGGGEFTAYAKKIIKGLDRYATCQAVLDFIKAGEK